jgi:hypothetical protein
LTALSGRGPGPGPGFPGDPGRVALLTDVLVLALDLDPDPDPDPDRDLIQGIPDPDPVSPIARGARLLERVRTARPGSALRTCQGSDLTLFGVRPGLGPRDFLQVLLSSG